MHVNTAHALFVAEIVVRPSVHNDLCKGLLSCQQLQCLAMQESSCHGGYVRPSPQATEYTAAFIN